MARPSQGNPVTHYRRKARRVLTRSTPSVGKSVAGVRRAQLRAHRLAVGFAQRGEIDLQRRALAVRNQADNRVVAEFAAERRRPPLAERKVQKRRVAPTAVGKRLVDEEKQTSPTHALMTVAGMGAIAWGGSRNRMIGRGLRSAAAQQGIDPRVQRALVTAERTRRMIETSTEPLGRITGRGIGRMPTPLRHALEDVPRPLRPATATLAGAILVQRGHPVRQKTYSPVVTY